MRYPVAIEPGYEATAIGVAVPDLPGCFSAGDTLDEAMLAADEAVAAWVDAALDAGQEIPPPTSLEAIRSNPEYSGWLFGVVNLHPLYLDDTVERVDLSLPRRVLERLDAMPHACGETRSELVAHLALGTSRACP